MIAEKPEIYADRYAKLTPEERAQLRAFLQGPLYLKLLRIISVFKPSPHCKGTGSGERDQFSDARANARLGEIRGWELYEQTIFLALNEPPQIREAVQETFPMEGRIDADWGKIPEPTKETATHARSNRRPSRPSHPARQ